MPHEIIFSESYGSDGIEYVFVKPSDQSGVVRLSSSLRDSTSNFFNYSGSILKDIFLPDGYPESVSKDYMRYQLWDTVQAFCSTISNTLTTQAVLKGVGVGDEVASPISAAITWILKDGTGMLSRIVFAWIGGSGLDADCKKWRLLADFINDIAMCIELLILPLYMEYSLQILCLSTSLKAIVGVAGGATRATITQHQAINGNTGDISAKDGSQETCVNLLASLIGVFILSSLGNSRFIWYLFMIMTIMHLYANWRAVKSLTLQTFNTERLNIAIKHYLLYNIAPVPEEVNDKESVVLGTGYSDINICGYQIKMGSSLKNLMKNDSLNIGKFQLFSNISKTGAYLLFPCMDERIIYVIIGKNHTPQDDLSAYFHAVLLGLVCSSIQNEKLELLEERNANNCLSLLKKEMKLVERNEPISSLNIEMYISLEQIALKEWEAFNDSFRKKGWKLDQHNLKMNKWVGSWKEIAGFVK